MTQPSTRRRPQGPAGSTRRTTGFTLIELMIAVAIIGILASIAYPSYQRYITESRRTDAKALLMNVAGQLERCYTVNNNYETCFESSYHDGSGLKEVLSENKFYILDEEEMTAYSYILTAAPRGVQKTRDENGCGTFTLSHKGERGADADGCW